MTLTKRRGPFHLKGRLALVERFFRYGKLPCTDLGYPNVYWLGRAFRHSFGSNLVEGGLQRQV